MPNYQVTFFFEGVNQATYGASAVYGWSETFFGVYSGDVDAVLKSPDVQTFIAKRREALAQQYRMSFVRVSDVDNPHLFKVLTLVNKLGANKGAGTQTTVVQAALLVDLVRLARDPVHAEPTHHRKFLLRGLPDGIFANNVIKTDASGWTPIKQFLDFIANHETGSNQRIGGANNAAWLGCRFHDPAFGKANVTTITIDPNDNRNIRVGPDAVLFTQGRVKITGTPFRQFNRTWTLLDKVTPAGTTLMVLGRSRSPIPAGLSYTGPGRAEWQRVQYQYGIFDQYTVVGPRIKKTGGVFRQARGKQSPKVA